MNETVLLVVILLNQGHWFGGEACSVEVRSNLEPAVALQWTWELQCAGATLAKGQDAIAADNKPIRFSITPPEVRVASAMRLVWRAVKPGDDAALAQGEIPVTVYPRDLLNAAVKRLEGKTLLVWDEPEGLPQFLERQHVAARSVASLTELTLRAERLILIGPDRIDRGLPGDTGLADRARAGASILILRQGKAESLGGFSFVERAAPNELKWAEKHFLTEGLRLIDRTGAKTLRALQLPANAAVLELAWYLPDTPANASGPRSAVLATQTLGKGRLVFCQMPLGDWASDPRSQLFLAAAFDYLQTPPEPTPPPGERERPAAEPVSPPSIPLDSGARP